MVELLSPDFNIEETMVENFIEGMKSRSTFSRNALRNFIALQIWEASINPEAARRNPKLSLQLVQVNVVMLVLVLINILSIKIKFFLL